MVSYPISQPPATTRRRYHTVTLKDPNSVQPVTINWEPHIPAGDTITTATSTAYVHGSTTTTTTDITIDSTAYTDTTTTTVLSSGVNTVMYDITVHVTTTAGYEDDRTILIHCTHR